MEERDDRRVAALLAAGPLVAMLLAHFFTRPGVEGLFQADLVALVLGSGLCALGVRRRRLLLLAPLVAALLVCIGHLLLGGTVGGSLALLWLWLAASAAASGLAGVGRALGAPWLSAGGLSAGVLWISMTGLFWADALAEQLPQERRYAFKQAVLHLDPATAAAFGAADFDRLHEPSIYRDLPIASSLVTPPAAGTTGGIWAAVGLIAWALALLLGVDREQAAPGPVP